MEGKRICKAIVVSMQEMTIVQDFLSLQLENLDVILGMQMAVDWKNLSMMFVVGTLSITPRGMIIGRDGSFL